MNLDKLKQKFPEINEAFFSKESGLNFLKIEVDKVAMNDLTKISRKISEYVDENDNSENAYMLEIYSPGTDKEIEIDKIDSFLNEHINIEFLEEEEKKKELNGVLIDADDKNILVSVNFKGQFRKIKIEKEKIISAKSIAVIKKR